MGREEEGRTFISCPFHLLIGAWPLWTRAGGDIVLPLKAKRESAAEQYYLSLHTPTSKTTCIYLYSNLQEED